jgi:hypothetical protein
MLEAEEVRMFCLDDRGRVFSVTGDFSIKNATFQPLDNGRSAVIQAMDELQTLDVKWPVREG